MDDLSLTRSTVKDLQDVGVLFLRRQCSVGVMRVNFDKAATRLRWVSPGGAEILRGYIEEMNEIERRPAKEHFVAISALLDRFDRWVKDGAKPPTPKPKAPVPVPAPVPTPAPTPQVSAPVPPPPVDLAPEPLLAETLVPPSEGDDVPPPPPDDPPAPPVPSSRTL